MENIVRENPSEREIKLAALPQKILNMKQDGLIKYSKGYLFWWTWTSSRHGGGITYSSKTKYWVWY